VKLVHLVGFIAEKFVTIHCHMNVKNYFRTSDIPFRTLTACLPKTKGEG